MCLRYSSQSIRVVYSVGIHEEELKDKMAVACVPTENNRYVLNKTGSAETK